MGVIQDLLATVYYRDDIHRNAKVGELPKTLVDQETQQDTLSGALKVIQFS